MTDQLDPNDPRSEDGQTRCIHCDAVIDTSEWYPVVTGDDAIYEFCDADCRDAWEGS